MQEPPYIQEVTSLLGPDSFKETMTHWQQEFATEILKACDEILFILLTQLLERMPLYIEISTY